MDLIIKSNYSIVDGRLALFAPVAVISLCDIFPCVEIKIIVELMQPQESNYTAIIPFGWMLIELVISPRNASCRRSTGSEPPFRSARINAFLPEFLNIFLTF